MGAFHGDSGGVWDCVQVDEVQPILELVGEGSGAGSTPNGGRNGRIRVPPVRGAGVIHRSVHAHIFLSRGRTYVSLPRPSYSQGF